jgi:iron complex outermembrane receptor protein
MRTPLPLILLSPVLAQELLLEPIEVRSKREVLTPYEIRESFSRDPGEALTKLEGLWRIRKGGIANDVVLRGFQRNNISLTVDGARLYGACPNRMDPPAFHVDFAEVKEIKVIKGPFDVETYGSLGGTVNIVTEKPPKGFRSRLNLTAGSFEYVNPSLKVSYRSGKGYVSAGYSYRYSKPYRTGEGKRFTEYANYREEFKDATAFSINTAWVKGGVEVSEGLSLEVSYTLQRVRDVLYPYLLMDSPEDNADRLSVALKMGRIRTLLYFSRVYHRMDNTKRTSAMFMETVARTRTLGAKLVLPLGEVSLGLEAFRWTWSSRTVMGTSLQHTIPDVDFTNAGAFLRFSRRLSENLALSGGLRLDHTRTEADPLKANTDLYYTYHNTRDTSRTDTYPSGNLQLTFRVSEGVNLFLGLGYGVRVPDAQERYFALNRMMGPDWVGNPGLRPSRNAELDVGFDLRGEVLSLRGSFFYSYVKDFVTVYDQTAVNNTGLGTVARSYANVDAKLLGGELSGILALTDTLFVSSGLSYVRGTKETDPSRGIEDRDLPEMPPLKGRTSLRYDTGDKFLELELLMSATQYNVDSDLKESKTSGWAVVNVRGGLDLGKLRIVAGVENLLDKFYYEHLSYLRDPFSAGNRVPEPGRSFYLNLSYTF